MKTIGLISILAALSACGVSETTRGACVNELRGTGPSLLMESVCRL